MKLVTLNFREVAMDGLPEKSGDYFVLNEYDGAEGLFYAHEYMFSSKHVAFNVSDEFETDKTRIDDVAFWTPCEELIRAINNCADVQEIKEGNEDV